MGFLAPPMKDRRLFRQLGCPSARVNRVDFANLRRHT
jgi:hypothetical protein